MSSVRPARLDLDAVLGNTPPSLVPNGARAPSLWRVQNDFVEAEKWKPGECARAIMRFLGLEAFNDEVFRLVVETYRAWQLVCFLRFQPEDALSLVSVVRNYCLTPNDLATRKVPRFPPPSSYNGCAGCWDSLSDSQKRRAWLPFWVATCQVKITEGGGGGGGADGS